MKGVAQNCFRQNDRIGCSLVYLDGFGHFLFGFGAVLFWPHTTATTIISNLTAGEFALEYAALLFYNDTKNN